MSDTSSTTDGLPDTTPDPGSVQNPGSHTDEQMQAQTCEQDLQSEEPDESVESDGEDDDPDLTRLSLKDDSECYVIAMNAIPQCYTTSLSDARSYMWEFARTMKSAVAFEHNCYLREGNNRDHIQLVGHYRLLVVPYDRPIASFTVHCIKELEEIDTLEEDCDSPQEDDEEEEDGKLASLIRHFTG